MRFIDFLKENKRLTSLLIRFLLCFFLFCAFMLLSVWLLPLVENTFWSVLLAVLRVVSLMRSLMLFLILISEITDIFENKSKGKNVSEKAQRCKSHPIADLVHMAQRDDIVRIIVIAHGKAIEIGARSDNKVGSSKFFDKRFYIESQEFLTAEDFETNLQPYAENGQLAVYSIDDIPVVRKKKMRELANRLRKGV